MKHCLKGGQGDIDVCWHRTDFCSCTCIECQLSNDTARETVLREQVQKLDPELFHFIKTQVLRKRM